MIPRGSATSAWPPRRAAPNRSRLRTNAAPTPSDVRSLTNLRRQGASLTRSRLFYTKSLAWMPSHVSDNLHRACLCRAKPVRGTRIDARCRTFLCRESPVTRMATDACSVRLLTNRMAVHLRRRHAGRSPTSIDAPMVAQTPTHHHFFRRASKNLAAAAMLLHGRPEPMTSEER
jgi:hypothetical protein